MEVENGTKPTYQPAYGPFVQYTNSGMITLLYQLRHSVSPDLSLTIHSLQPDPYPHFPAYHMNCNLDKDGNKQKEESRARSWLAN